MREVEIAEIFALVGDADLFEGGSEMVRRKRALRIDPDGIEIAGAGDLPAGADILEQHQLDGAAKVGAVKFSLELLHQEFGAFVAKVGDHATRDAAAAGRAFDAVDELLGEKGLGLLDGGVDFFEVVGRQRARVAAELESFVKGGGVDGDEVVFADGQILELERVAFRAGDFTLVNFLNILRGDGKDFLDRQLGFRNAALESAGVRGIGLGVEPGALRRILRERGADPENDCAVIRIKAPPEVLYPVALGDSSKLRVGMRCFAIGNPFGLERTLTSGVVSSLDRSLQIRGNRSVKQIIQIDASINPGNSGGPLLDTHGRLIGINTAIASKTGQSAGVGFAIPVSLVARVVPELIRLGKVIRPEIGIRLFETDKGLMVAQLQPNGSAERAGLKGPKVTRKRTGPFVVERADRESADLIVAVDGDDVKSQDDFLTAIEKKRPGEQVIVTVIREGRRTNIPVTLSGPAEK